MGNQERAAWSVLDSEEKQTFAQFLASLADRPVYLVPAQAHYFRASDAAECKRASALLVSLRSYEVGQHDLKELVAVNWIPRKRKGILGRVAFLPHCDIPVYLLLASQPDQAELQIVRKRWPGIILADLLRARTETSLCQEGETS